MRITVGITGASGSVYALRLLENLRRLGVETDLVVSDAGREVTRQECGAGQDEFAAMCTAFHENRNIGASIASGSHPSDGMVIVPCSMRTLAAVAAGFADNLLTRAADVCIKERRLLILVVREAPLSAIHLENMLKLARLGVVILPACPAFYHHPREIEDLTDFVVGKILDQLGIEHEIYQRWTGERE